MTVLEQLGEWLTDTIDGSLPRSIHQRLALHLLDTVGAWVAGSVTEEGQMLARLVSNPTQPISALGHQPLDRIALGVATTRLTEIDDIHMPSCTTPSSVVIPTALVLAAHLQNRDARVFAHAMNAGYEVMTRFSASVAGPSLLRLGRWPTYLAAPVCAAAVAARMLGLGAEKTVDALGIALTTISSAAGRPIGTSPRWLLLGLAARAGCTAALAAAEGYAGDRTLLDGNWLPGTHGIHCDAGKLMHAADGDGAVSALSFKPYCAAKQTIAATEALLELLSDGISPDDIVSLRVSVPAAYAEMIGHQDASGSRMNRITSAAYQLALAAYRPKELMNVARPNLAGDSKIAAFMSRVKVVPEMSLEKYYPERWPARIRAELKNGRKRTILVIDATGDPPRAGQLGLRDKFQGLVDPVIGTSAANELAEACLNATENDEALAFLCGKFNSERAELSP